MQLGESIGNTNVGALIGYVYRQCAYNDGNQNCYLQITNTYAIGKVTSSGEVGGLIGQLLSTYNGSTTTTNSYWTPETTMQETSKAGTIKNIQSMLYGTGYISWDMNNIWKIENGTTVAYLKNVNKPESVKKENIVYEAYDILGGGTTQDPYIITTAVQLQNINENLEASYKLGANIDLTGIDWTPIGNSTYQFKGTLDGNGYTISNLSILKDEDNIGLFGYSQGTIKNVKLNNFNIKGKSNVGGLVAVNSGTVAGSEITNSIIEGTVNYVGGLVGYSSGTINNSKAQGTITGTNYVGELVRMCSRKCYIL